MGTPASMNLRFQGLIPIDGGMRCRAAACASGCAVPDWVERLVRGSQLREDDLLSRTARKTRQKIVAAAVKCINEKGVSATSMEDVAEAAGLTRRTVYRHFGDRKALIYAVISFRVASLEAAISSFFASMPLLEEALVEGVMVSLEAARADQLLREVVEEQSDHGIEQLLFRGSPEVRSLMNTLWFPLIDAARKRTKICPATNFEIVDWIRNVSGMLFLRYDEYTDAEIQRMLSTFLRDAIVPPSGRLESDRRNLASTT